MRIRHIITMSLSLLLVAFWGCSDKRRSDGSSPSSKGAESLDDARAAPPAGSTNCIPLWPVPVHLSGVLAAEEHFGPPGYGETPGHDRRVRILIVKLQAPVTVCADTSSVAPQPLLKDAVSMQLTEVTTIPDLERLLGDQVEVYGTLRRRVWGGDYTEALVRVDSITKWRGQRGQRT
jgi:hypothetical protein